MGLHTGAQVTLTLRPAPADHGIVFHRVDLPGSPGIPATAAYVVDTALATNLGSAEARVGTVEHLLAALSGLGIDNVRVEVDGPEVPILDGSSGPFLYLVRSAGIRILEEPKSFVVIQRPVTLRDGDREASLSPCDRLRIDCTIDFQHPLVPGQSLSHRLLERPLHPRARPGADLRLPEGRGADEVRRAGARAARWRTPSSWTSSASSTPRGCATRTSSCGTRCWTRSATWRCSAIRSSGTSRCGKSGHALHHRLVSRVLADASRFAIVRARRRELERLDLRLPDFALALESL